MVIRERSQQLFKALRWSFKFAQRDIKVAIGECRRQQIETGIIGCAHGACEPLFFVKQRVERVGFERFPTQVLGGGALQVQVPHQGATAA